MKIAILQCDDVLDKFQVDYGNYPEMIERMFLRQNENISFETFDVRINVYPTQPDVFDLFVITGSKASVYDDAQWIKYLIVYVKQLHDQNRKLFGICFGHQVIAVALGAKVKKSDKGWGVGVANNLIVKSKSWLGSDISKLSLLVSHQDQVFDLPSGFDIIANSVFCPNFMIQWSESTLSVQGHPEWECGYSEALMNHRKEVIPPDVLETGLNSLTQGVDNDMLAKWVLSFIR